MIRVFYKKLFIYIAVIVAAAMVLGVVCRPSYRNSLLYSYNDKIELLKNSMDENRRVIFMGGSATLFGINAQYYEELSDCKCINLGLQAMRSYDIYFSTVEQYIKAGDTLVLPLEYSAYEYEWWEYDDVGLDLAWLTEGYAQRIPPARRISYEYSQFLRTFSRGWYVLYMSCIQPLAKQEEKLYLRKNIDLFGDITSHEHMESTVRSGTAFNCRMNDESLEIMKQYISSFEEKGATVYIIFPPYCIDSRDDNNEKLAEVYSQLVDCFGDRVLGHPDDSMYTDVSCFLDTHYHLVYKESLAYTQKVYEMIVEKNP